MIIYSSNCLACSNKKLWKQVINYTLNNKIKFEVRRVDISKDFRAEAELFNQPLPFGVLNGRVVRLEEL